MTCNAECRSVSSTVDLGHVFFALASTRNHHTFSDNIHQLSVTLMRSLHVVSRQSFATQRSNEFGTFVSSTIRTLCTRCSRGWVSTLLHQKHNFTRIFALGYTSVSRRDLAISVPTIRGHTSTRLYQESRGYMSCPGAHGRLPSRHGVDLLGMNIGDRLTSLGTCRGAHGL